MRKVESLARVFGEKIMPKVVEGKTLSDVSSEGEGDETLFAEMLCGGLQRPAERV